MNRVLDNGLVALVLLASVGYALSSLGPKTLRRRLWSALAHLASNAPASLRLQGMAQRLQAAADKTGGSCGGCGSCEPESSDADKKSASEVRVPLTRIGKRR
jgi:hypothetical protein